MASEYMSRRRGTYLGDGLEGHLSSPHANHERLVIDGPGAASVDGDRLLLLLLVVVIGGGHIVAGSLGASDARLCCARERPVEK